MYKKKVERQERSDKRIRVNLSLDKETHDKLKQLAVACDLPKTKLASEMVEMSVNHMDIIEFYQRKYCKHEKFRVIPVRHNGKVHYS